VAVQPANPVWQDVLSEINHCNKCGFCLPACPTYRLTGNEVDSPRGRIAMVEAVARGEMPIGEALEKSLDYCLGCRACETACPSGVDYIRIYEAGVRALHAVRKPRPMWLAQQMLTLVKHPRRLARMARLAERLKNLPWPAAFRPYRGMLGYRTKAINVPANPPDAAQTVLFFGGCVQSAVFPDANQAAVALLRWAGYQVVTPVGQTCCGALHWHNGEESQALELAKQNIVAFERTPDAWIVNTAGGCGAMLSEYGKIFADDPAWSARAAAFSGRVRDWTTLLRQAPRPLTFQGTGERVTLQNSCHLVNVEKAGADPVWLLQQVTGDDFRPMPGQDRCCGSAGIYNLEHPDWSVAILDRKMEEVEGLEVDRVVAVNPGCQLQMQWGVARHDGRQAVEHLARYLYRAHQRARQAGGERHG